MVCRLRQNVTTRSAVAGIRRVKFARLMPATAERVVTFWRNRQTI